ncbi:MAG: hypothetical protein O7D91_11450 [Planctomycetota bacterium]|nr:hypothetical protein [Planctomycetota bacterium]
MSQFLCVEGASVPLPSPLNDLECPPAGSDLQEFQDNLICLECRKSGSISAEDLKLYKTKRSGKYTMYTVPECLESCSASSAEPLYGEVINGDFIAPADGFLFAKVEGANSVVDVYVSGSPGEQGWQVPPNARHGQPLDPDSCIDLSGGQSFQFNIRAGRGEPPSFIMITFDWYWWDAGNCCIQHDTKELTIQIEQMRVHLVDPLVPKRARVARSQGEDTELRIPQCSTVDNPGNLTQWFVMWPTTGGQIIQEGHAKGWTIVDDKLFPPGTRETEYEFEE